MEHYHKLFVKASILYLIIGSSIGLLISIPLIDPLSFRFAHIHFNLLGFMAMMIYGVAYHILPRFNGRPLRWPVLVKLHFYLANIGLVGMVIFYLMRMRGLWSLSSIMIGLFAIISVASIIIFAINIYSILNEGRMRIEEVERDKITPEMKVSDVIERWPQVLSIFITNGFKSLANPVVRATMSRLVTIRQACRIHRVDPDIFITILNAGIKKEKKGNVVHKEYPLSEVIGRSEPTIKEGNYCTKDVLVGELIKVYPETRSVFERHYGESCFQCPGQAYETIEQTASMHNVEITKILDEINNLIARRKINAAIH